MEDVRWHYSEEPGVYALTTRYALLVWRRGHHRRYGWLEPPRALRAVAVDMALAGRWPELDVVVSLSRAVG